MAITGKRGPYKKRSREPAAPLTKPSEGSQTRDQSQHTGFYGPGQPFIDGALVPGWGNQLAGMGLNTWPMGFSASGGVGIMGYGPTWPGTFTNYRIIRRDPTIALVRNRVMSEITAGDSQIKALDGTPDDRVNFVKSVFLPLRMDIVTDCLRALDYGFYAGEPCWVMKDGKWVIHEVKGLLVDRTRPMVDPDNGDFVGWDNFDDELLERKGKAFRFTYNGEPGPTKYYGESRLENVRRTVFEYFHESQNSAKLANKAAGIIVVIKFPPGTGLDEQKNEVSRLSQAIKLGQQITSGSGYVCVENYAGIQLKSIRSIEDLIKLSQGSMWHIDSFDLGQQGQSINAVLSSRQYLDVLKIRGYLQPERSLIEGQHGTQAESGVHTDTGTLDCEDIDRRITMAINRGLIDPLLEFNYGIEARGSVYAESRPLRDAQAAVDEAVIEFTLRAQELAPQVYATHDIGQVFDRRGIPKRAKDLPLPLPGSQPKSPPAASGDGGGNGSPSSPPSSSSKGASNGRRFTSPRQR